MSEKKDETVPSQDSALKKASGNKGKKKTAEQIAKEQANHEHYKWFDEFEARIQKKEVRNMYTQRNETIITGWQLSVKKHPKFIEPSNALAQNAFANGADTFGIFNYLVPKDEKKSGDFITYKDWAIEQGKDLKSDINIILNS